MSMTRDFSFVIVGGGILGSALAALAVSNGFEPLVIRRPDTISPHADTLRNQGWLQSGIMYPISHFADESAYRVFADRTFFAGRDLLKMCRLPVSESGGLLGVSGAHHLEQLARKRALLKFSENEFHQLAMHDAKMIMGEHYEPDTAYYRIPDGPFDEAAVVAHFRDSATLKDQAVFLEVDDGVRLQQGAESVKVLFGDGYEIESPTVVVTAGVGSFELMAQCGVALNGNLQRTPLAVGDAPFDMPAPIMVDLGRGFSAVRHHRGNALAAAVVMGTRAKDRHDWPPERTVPLKAQAEFANGVPPAFQASMMGARYTAGYEVMPAPETGINAYQPWLQPAGPLIFASPGRATVSFLAAEDLMTLVHRRLKQVGYGRTSRVDISDCSAWDCPIAMHYMPNYTYDDAEV